MSSELRLCSQPCQLKIKHVKHHVLVNKLFLFEMAGASRRVHNSIQFQFSDPLSKLATSRTTRYRIKKKRRCDMAIGEAGQQTTVNADCECAEHVEQNDKQEAYTTVTDEPFNVPENDVMLEQHFVPILRDLPEEPEFLPND